MNYDSQEIGRIIKRERRQKGLTQKELAELLNISQSYLSLIEKGDREITDNLLPELKKTIGIDINDLFVKTIDTAVGTLKNLEGRIDIIDEIDLLINSLIKLKHKIK
jgi:transcriptional regulator with XRE-family HTH domain